MNEKKFDMRKLLSRAASVIEITLGLLILAACVVTSIGLIFTTDVQNLFQDPAYLRNRISDGCLIIIGVELIEMIASYSIDSVVDVMLLAVARQMIIEHTAPVENLLTVAAIGVLFVIRKYLYVSRLDGHGRHNSKDKNKSENKQEEHPE